MRTIITAPILVLLLGGCAEYEALKAIGPIAADRAADGAYNFSCNLRYKTERRFLARRDIDKSAFKIYCKRPLP